MFHKALRFTKDLIDFLENLVFEFSKILTRHYLMLQCLQIAKCHVKDNLVGLLASEEEEVEDGERTLHRQALSEESDEPRDGVVQQAEVELGMVKLGLNLWQKAVLPKNLLQDGGLGPDSKHLYIVIRWHVGLHDLDERPKRIFLIEDLPQPEDQEVEALNVADGGVPPDVGTEDSLNGRLDLWRVELLLREGSRYVPCDLLKHGVGVLLDHVILQC